MKTNLLGMAALASSLFFLKPEAKAQTVSVGPRLGLNISTIHYSDGKLDDSFIEKKTNQIGALGGVMVNIGINEAFSIQPEVLFSQKGYGFEDGRYKVTESLNYLEVPLLAKLTLGSGNMKFFVNAGPYAAYLMSGKITHNFTGREESYAVQFEYENDGFNANRVKPNRLDLGLAAGAGMALKAGIGTLNIEARYGLGLTNINEYEHGRPSGVSKVTNGSLALSLGYLIPLGK